MAAIAADDAPLFLPVAEVARHETRMTGLLAVLDHAKTFQGQPNWGAGGGYFKNPLYGNVPQARHACANCSPNRSSLSR